MKTIRYLLIALAVAGCPQAPKLVLPNPPVIDRFTATPATVARGGMVTLEWGTADATEVQIVQVGVGPVAGVDNKPTGSTTVTVTQQSLFVLNASNSRGVKTTALATVAVEGAAQQVMFAALPALIGPGQAATLVWTAPGARSVTLTSEGGTAIDLRGQVETGSVEVTPTVGTRYTLTVDGTSRTVDVAITQSITMFAASKTLADAGESVTLSWQTANATKVTLNQPGRGTLFSSGDAGTMLASGSVMDLVPPYATGTVVPYELVVEGAGPAISQVARIVVGNQPVINTFTGPEYAKQGGRFRLTWTTLNADAVELATGGTTFYRSVTAAEAASGFLELPTPAAQTDYTLTALNTRASVSVTKSFTQKVVGAVTLTSFTATPAMVVAGGDPVTLTWNAPGARHVVITDGQGHTVASARGPTAETGTGTAYPNGPTTYRLSADNTIDPAVTSTASVTVTTPAAFGAAGTILAGDTVAITWTVGASGLIGFPGGTATVQAASTGFVDIATTGTKLTFVSSDDGTATFTPPDFETFLWNERVTGTFTASTNGFVALVPTAAARGTTTALPNSTVERNFLAPWWADLTVPANGGVYWQVLNEAPERTLVVQWDHVRAKAAMGSDLVFQVQVHQTGKVTFEYRTLSMTGTVMPVIGVQGPPNTAQVGPAPSANSSTTFFGGIMSPLMRTLLAPETITGFIRLTNGYLRPRFTANVVRVGEVFVSEVMYRPQPSLTGGEWLEVTNISQSVIDLAGWSIDLADAGTITIDAGLTLTPGASVVLGQTLADAGVNDDVAVTYAYGPLVLPDAPAAVSVGRGAFRSTSNYTPALAGSDAGVSVNIDNQPHLVTGDTSTTTPHGVSCNSTTPIGSQTPRQLATPGAFWPCGVPFKMSGVAPSYFDISMTGTPIFNSSLGFDETVAPVTMPVAFPFDGTMATQVGVSTNGFVVLKVYTTGAGLTNKVAPSTAAPSGSVVAVFWDDLDSNDAFLDSNVYWKRVAPNEDPLNPGGHTIFQWHHYNHWIANDDLNFQVKLFDTGVIEYHFATMQSGSTSNYGNGNSATIWLENAAGNSALVVGRNQPVITSNMAIRFTP